MQDLITKIIQPKTTQIVLRDSKCILLQTIVVFMIYSIQELYQ